MGRTKLRLAKTMFAIGAGILPSSAHAQLRPDPIFVQYTRYDGSTSSVEGGLGPPPLKIGRLFWVNSLSGRALRLDLGSRIADTTKLAFGSVLRISLDARSSLSIGGSLAFRTADDGVQLSSRTAFGTGLLFYSRSFGSNERSRWFAGLVLPDRSGSLFILPAVGFEYVTPSEDWQVVVGWPGSAVSYGPTDRSRIGILTLFEGASYARSTNQTYLRSERLVSAFSLKQALYRGLSGQLRLGRTWKGRSFEQNSEFERIRTYKDSAGLYLSVGLSQRFD